MPVIGYPDYSGYSRYPDYSLDKKYYQDIANYILTSHIPQMRTETRPVRPQAKRGSPDRSNFPNVDWRFARMIVSCTWDPFHVGGHYETQRLHIVDQ
jgi:hypothetical protein